MYTVWLVARDSRTPLHTKILAFVVGAYAFSPIDLIPDFIPVIGYLDDLLIVPAGIWLVIKMTPKIVIQDCHERARLHHSTPISRVAAGVIIGLWLSAIAVSIYLWGY
jgi:uncharacterized membrane protein YkvA (DUF1232 family)